MNTKKGRSPPTDPQREIGPKIGQRIVNILLITNSKSMRTTVIESGKNTAVNGKADNRNGVTAKTINTNGSLQTAGSSIAPSKTFHSANVGSESKKTEASAAVQAGEQSKSQAEQPKEVKPEAPKAEAEKPKAELTKDEIKEALATQKPALNLEGTLKLVEELHRRKVQRDKLLDTIETLEIFEVAQKDDAEETDSNHFQGCELTIEDDKRRQFTTKNPFIIKKVAEYINALCLDRLAEIEGEIFLPA